jgi:large subunit ribosomal protein L17
MLANMACSLIEHKRINTTVAKAKALKQFIEPLITKSKAGNNVTTEKGTHNRRIVFKNLRDKSAVSELFSSVAEKVGDRPGGYTRIIKLGNRSGDNADMAMIELVDFNEIYTAGKPKKKKSTRRGGSKKTEDSDGAAKAKTETKDAKEDKVTTAKKEEVKAKPETEPVEKAKPASENEAEASNNEADSSEASPEQEPETKAEAGEDEKEESKKDDSKE